MILSSKLIQALAGTILCATTFGCAAISDQRGAVVVQTFPDCSAPDPRNPEFGNRAFIADNGLALVLQCADGTARAWEAKQSKTINLGKVTLFSAAAKLEIIPSDLRCAEFSGFSADADCDVIDHTKDWSAYIVRAKSNTYSIVNASSETPKMLNVYTGGVLLPRAGPASDVVLGQDSSRKGLEIRSFLNWSAKPFVKPLLRNGFFQSTETDIDKIFYSDAHDLLILSCGGAFIYFEDDVALVRAYSLDGTERWTIRKHLPKPKESGGLHEGFTSIHAWVKLFAGGRYATMNSSEERPSFDVVDLGTGKTVASLAGFPIATAAIGNRILIRTFSGEFALIDVGKVVQ